MLRVQARERGGEHAAAHWRSNRSGRRRLPERVRGNRFDVQRSSKPVPDRHPRAFKVIVNFAEETSVRSRPAGRPWCSFHGCPPARDRDYLKRSGQVGEARGREVKRALGYAVDWPELEML